MATRRKQPKRPKSAKARAKARSAAARKGWVTRKFLANPLPLILKTAVEVHKSGGDQRAAFDSMVHATVDAIKQRGAVKNFAQARLLALGTGSPLHGSFSKAHKVLVSYVENEQPEWLYYLDLCEQAGLDMEEARDYWFSPEV